MSVGNEEAAGPADAVERAMVAIRRRQSRRALAGEAEAAGLPVVDPALTAVVDAVEAGPAATVTSVAVALGVDQPRASKLVARAVEAGLVRREADQRDGRRSLLALTPAGADHARRIHGFRRAAFERAMAGWDEGERREFGRLLARFVEALGPPPRN